MTQLSILPNQITQTNYINITFKQEFNMIINNNVKALSLKLLLVLFLAFGFVCGKSDGEKTGENKSGEDKKTETKSDDKGSTFSPDKPFMVEFEITGAENRTGTVSAIYFGKKCRSTSNFSIEGKKMGSTAYYDGGNMVYTVTEVGGIKMGMKFDKSKFADSKDNMDVNSFRDYLDKMDKIGEEEILGYKCEIYKFKDKDVTVSLYDKTVPLRMGGADGKTYMKAIKFEKDVKATDDMFTPPADVQYTDMTDMMDGMQKMGNNKDLKKNMEELKDKTKEMEEIMKNYKK